MLYEQGGPSWSGLVGPLGVAEPVGFYRPRHPERSSFYKAFEEHFERYLYAYEERFEARSGPLRPFVQKAVDAFLECGRLQGGKRCRPHFERPQRDSNRSAAGLPIIPVIPSTGPSE